MEGVEREPDCRSQRIRPGNPCNNGTYATIMQLDRHIIQELIDSLDNESTICSRRYQTVTYFITQLQVSNLNIS